MVKIMNGSNPMNKWMIWGGFPIFLETPIAKGCDESSRESFVNLSETFVLFAVLLNTYF